MINVAIKHNPFTIETCFLINDQKPENNSQLAEYENQRLQLWIEGFFQKLYDIFNGEEQYRVHFKGVEADCVDMEEAVKQANEDGLDVKMSYDIVPGSEERLDKIQQLILEAKQDPLFKQYVNTPDVLKKFDAAFDKNFDVYVVATMSSGKSTLINAMLGCDLLPALNEATTATIAKITDYDHISQGHFTVSCKDSEGYIVNEQQELDLTTKIGAESAAQLMSEWNKSPDVFRINIEGKIPAIEERESVRLVLTDTPGPNNSQDIEHNLTTMRYIGDSDRHPLVLYILNGQQLGINDDRSLLRQIADVMSKGGKQSKDRFIFVINKADVFDPEKGEYIENVVTRAKQYLKNNGIANPLVYPVSASLTSLLRKRELSIDLLTRSERGDLSAMEDLFNEEPLMDLVQYMPLSKNTQEKINKKNYSTVLYRSGLPAVEMMIDDYIEKYSLPNRVTRANQALSQIIQQSTNAAELQKSLETDEQNLNKLQENINLLREKEKQAFKSDGYINKVKNQQKGIRKETAQAFMLEEKKLREIIYDFGNAFQGEASKRQAQNKINKLTRDLQSEFNLLVVNLENMIESDQLEIQKDLSTDYNRYIASLFDDVSELDLPILEGLKNHMVSFSISLEEDEIQVKRHRVQTGTRTVSAKWYNPFSWFSSREEAVYETVEEEFVSLDDLWEDRGPEIDTVFANLLIDAKQKIQDNSDKTISIYIEFMNEEFSERFNNLMSDLEEKVEDKNKRKEAIDVARMELDHIEKFNSKISDILTL
ncbi:dynamin family protein [Psychrobacter submarinus]|uniref:dynamin family protein n=1 Tax=Psychrobacter submarinus TaxID=154108 RepID=UPI001917D804|nr:dynamin family protein [Psychrobacter submarinus]